MKLEACESTRSKINDFILTQNFLYVIKKYLIKYAQVSPTLPKNTTQGHLL